MMAAETGREAGTLDPEHERLDEPAGAFLDGIPWEGPSPDPETTDAATFLAWL
jgi:hypothetical protein